MDRVGVRRTVAVVLAVLAGFLIWLGAVSNPMAASLGVLGTALLAVLTLVDVDKLLSGRPR